MTNLKNSGVSSWGFIACIIFISIGVGIFVWEKNTTPRVTVGEHTFDIIVAKTEVERERGLGYRTSLPKNTGMLFLFDTPRVQTFWMKGMQFPIDIIFIRDTTIVTIYKNVPFFPPDTPNSALPLYRSKEPADIVLEINAGLTDTYGIQEGDGVVVHNK